MPTHLLLARWLLSGLCALQGLATLAIDFNRTHATNPAWTGHARFHVVWQSFNTAILSGVQLALIWWAGPYQVEGFYLAVFLAAISPAGFLLACVGRKVYAGTLSDPNGIPPLLVPMRGRTFSVDLNLVAVVAALLFLAAILAIYRAAA